MKLSDEQINEIQEMAAALLSPIEIAVLLGIPTDEQAYFIDVCKNHKSSVIYIAYQKGKLKTKYELHKTIIKLAKAGSPAAEPLADRYMKDQQMRE